MHPKTLTREQAALFRDCRKRVIAAVNEVAAVRDLFLKACPHIDPEQPETCHVCRIYKMFEGAAGEIHDARDVVEAALTNGPHPNAKNTGA